MLMGEYDDAYESADDCDADDWLRVGGDSDGVREGARDEPRDALAQYAARYACWSTNERGES